MLPLYFPLIVFISLLCLMFILILGQGGGGGEWVFVENCGRKWLEVGFFNIFLLIFRDLFSAFGIRHWKRLILGVFLGRISLIFVL